MATFTVIEQMRLDDYAVIQTLETTDIAIGQSITLSGMGNGLNGTHVVYAIPTHLFAGVDSEGDLVYNYDEIVTNQILFYDAGDDVARSAVIPNGTLTWTQTCTWITSADVQVFLGITSATANDTAFLTQCVNASNAWCFARRVQAGYHDALGTVPSDAAKMGAVLMAASLYRERGSIDSFQTFEGMGTAPIMSMGRVNQLLGIKRSQVA
jgi:hypothetical protein